MNTGPPSPPKPRSEVFLVERREDNELSLENMASEMLMEQVRQLGSKLSFQMLHPAVTRTLRYGKSTLDHVTRVDCLKGLAYMRANMPIDAEIGRDEQFRILSESLGCSLQSSIDGGGWIVTSSTIEMTFRMDEEEQVAEVSISVHGEPAFVSEDARRMLRDGQWTEFRDRIAQIESFYDKNISSEDLPLCKQAWRMMLSMLAEQASDDRFEALNRLNYGYYLPQSDLRAGRIYYLIEPLYRNYCAKRKQFRLQERDWDRLPYFEFSFIEHTDAMRLGEMPTNDGVWNEKTSVRAAIRLKLARPVLISRATKQAFGRISAKTVSVRNYTNCYRYLLGKSEEEVSTGDVLMMTQFPDGPQHVYTVDRDSLLGVDDYIITEIFLRRFDDLATVVRLLRNERMHHSLWESVLAMCYERQGLAEQLVPAIPMRLVPRRDVFSVHVDTVYDAVSVHITDSPGSGLDARVEVLRGPAEQPLQKTRISTAIDETMSRKLTQTWSIPTVLSLLVSEQDCRQMAQVRVPLRQENPETATTSTKTTRR